MPEQKGFEDSVIEGVLGNMDAMIDAIAARLGTPPGGAKYSRQQQIDEWTFSPYADPQERMNKALELHMQGKTPEEITDDLYPNRRRLITTGRPRTSEQIAFAREMRKLAGEPDEVPGIDGAISDPMMRPIVAPQPGMPPITLPEPPPVPPMMPPAMPQQPMAAPAPAFNPLTGTSSMVGG